MFSSLLRRTAAAVLLATASTSLVAVGTAGSAIGAGPHSTSISIRTAHPAVAPGGTDTVLGNLRVGNGQALPGKTVTLESRLAGDAGFLPVGTAVSGPQGGISLPVTPAETTRYRWTFAGDAADNASVSGVATVRVRVPHGAPTRLPATLSIRVAHPMVTLAGTDVVSGRLLSGRFPLRQKRVLLISRRAGATDWTFNRAGRTNQSGGIAFVVKPPAATYFRLVFEGTSNFRRARSAVVHVAVRSTMLTIALSAMQVAPGGPATVSGVLTDHAAPYAGQSVQLWGKPVGTNKKFAALAAGTTAADGSVSFNVTPVKTMRYYLFFPHTATAPAAQSATRTLAVS